MKLHIEIRPCEGGEDARLLVRDQARIYLNHAERNHIKVEVIDDRES